MPLRFNDPDPRCPHCGTKATEVPVGTRGDIIIHKYPCACYADPRRHWIIRVWQDRLEFHVRPRGATP